MSGERSESGSLRRLSQSSEISKIFLETGIAELASEILRSLEKALDELDIGTIKHSLGTAVLALVLIKQLIDSAGKLREAQAVTTGDQQSEVPATSDEKIKEFWSRLNEYLRGVASTSNEVVSTSSQTEVLTTPESSKALELWNVLLRYLPLFLLFLLLHDYGKRFISDIVNSTIRFSNEQKKLADFTLNVLQQRLVDSSIDFSTNPSSQTSSYQLREPLEIWTLEGMKAVLLSFPAIKASFQTRQGSNNNLRQEVESLLTQFIKNPQVNQRKLVPITQVAETDAQMAARWLLIMIHPAQGFLDVAETIINQLGQSNDLSPEDKAYITAIAVGVIAGHHTPGGNSGYPPVDVLVSVLEHCLNHLGIDSNVEFWSKAQDLMLFAASFSKIIDVMQASCFDERAYNQDATRPLPTKLKFGSQESDTGDTAQFGSQMSDTGGKKLQKQMDDFLKFLYDWICKKAFSGLNELNPNGHSTVSAYDLIYQAILNQPISNNDPNLNLDSVANSMMMNYGSIINNLSQTLSILSSQHPPQQFS